MSEKISTKAGIFESGEKDVYGVQYKGARLIACRDNKLEDYVVADDTEVICDRAFMNLRELKRVTLPDSLKAIGESAFSGCKSLSEINIPNGVTEIRQATFRDCEALSTIELPASVEEIDQFAFGSGLKTLVVNAQKIAIDKYAFMKSRDFSTLIVPAGTAEYYRGQLFDCRVKATVEEMEEKTEEPASMLDAFMAEPEKVIEEAKEIFKTNRMEEKKMKTVNIEVYGTELFLEPKDSNDENVYDAYSRFKRNGMVFTVDGSEYGPIDFGIDYNVLTQEQIDEFKDFDVTKFFEESGAKEGMLYTNKAWTTIEIEIPEDEEFKANKACLVTKKFIYPDGDSDVTVCAFGYDGKLYDCAPGDSEGVSGEKIWPERESEEEDDDWGSWDDEEPEEDEETEEEVQKYGFVNKSGNVVIEPIFDSVSDFCEGVAKVRIDDKYGYIDKNGTYIAEPKFDDAEDFKGGFAQVVLDDKYGYIDKHGAYIVEPKFDYGYPFIEGRAIIQLDRKYGYIDESGAYIIEPTFDDAEKFCEGAAKVELDGLYGFIDKSGAYIVEPKFDAVKDFCEGIANVKLDGKWGCIDKNGVYVIEPQYDYVGLFSDGLAMIKGK